MEAQAIESKLETLATGQRMLAASVDRIENGLFGDDAFSNEGLIKKQARHEQILKDHAEELKKIKDRHFKTTAVVGAAGVAGGWGAKAILAKIFAIFH